MNRQYFLQQIGKRVFILDENGQRKGTKSHRQNGFESFQSASKYKWYLTNAADTIRHTEILKSEHNKRLEHLDNL